MRKIGLALAVAGAFVIGIAFSGGAKAAPAMGIGPASEELNIVDQVQYVYGGYRHCWYANGWKGPGWYRCGYHNRRGYGWGGPVGWNGWAAPGVAVAVPGAVVVAPAGRYYYGGRYWNGRRWHGGRWVYY
jgi:hypothetical protein